MPKDSVVHIFPIRDIGLANIKDARVIDEDDVGLTVRYKLRGMEASCTSLIPWSSIARVEYRDAEVSA